MVNVLITTWMSNYHNDDALNTERFLINIRLNKGLYILASLPKMGVVIQHLPSHPC